MASEPSVLVDFKCSWPIVFLIVTGLEKNIPSLIWYLCYFYRRINYQNACLFCISTYRKPNQPIPSSNFSKTKGKVSTCIDNHFFAPTPLLTFSLVPASPSFGLPVLIVYVFIVFPINDILFHFNYYFNKPGNSSEKLLIFLSSDAAFGLQGC